MKDAGRETFKQYVKAGAKQCNGLTNWLDFHYLLPSPVAADAAQGAVIGEKDIFYIARNGLPRKVNRNGTDGSMGLARLIAMRHAGLLPTPIATDRKGGTDKTLVRHSHKKAEKSNLTEQIAHKTGGGNFHLNPLFVEEMMGFPEGWTIFPFLKENGDGRR